MFRAVLPFAKAYAIAILPIAVVMAGVTWIENLMYPYVPLSDQEWEIRFTVWEVFVITYIVAFAYALPIFAILRWIAGKRGWLSFKSAIFGGLLAGLSFPILGLLFKSLGQNHLLLVATIFALTGAVCGAVYWWAEKRFSDDPNINLKQGLPT